MFTDCDFFVDIIEKFDSEFVTAVRLSDYPLQRWNLQLAGEILSLEPETCMIAHNNECSLLSVSFGGQEDFIISARTYSLTYSLEQSPSWEANKFSASQEIPRILWNPKVHYHSQKCLPPVTIVSQLDPAHARTSNFLNFHLNIILL